MKTYQRLEKKYKLEKDTLKEIADQLEELEKLKKADSEIMEAIRGGLYYAKIREVNFKVAFSMYVSILKNKKE